MSNKEKITKRKYCRGLQCKKMLWLDTHRPSEAQAFEVDFMIANVGEVNRLGCEYFGKYTRVLEDLSFEEKLLETKRLMASGERSIADGVFMADGISCSVDLLRYKSGGWYIVFIKNATHITEHTKEELAYVNYVLCRCNIKVKGISCLYINNDYCFDKTLNLKELFVLEDLTYETRTKFRKVNDTIKLLRTDIPMETEPHTKIGMQCMKPVECEYRSYCWKEIPPQSVFDVKGMQAEVRFDYYYNGIVTFKDLLEHSENLTIQQIQQIETELLHREPSIDRKGIKEFLSTLSYPIYYLDFETYQTAVPEYNGVRPYHQIPFQYSLHIQYEDGRVEHKEFLAKEGTDSRKALAIQLCNDIPKGACGIAYSMEFEKFVLKELAEHVPELAEHLLSIRENMHDLMYPFQKRMYYTEAMLGSHSLKYVLPAVCCDNPELDYSRLEQIQNGAQAASAYANMKSYNEEEKIRLRRNLLLYCGLDTYAMVKIVDKLRTL